MFDGKDLSKWAQKGVGGKMVEPGWKVENGYISKWRRARAICSRATKFGDAQIHVEWSEPTTAHGGSQDRENSGV